MKHPLPHFHLANIRTILVGLVYAIYIGFGILVFIEASDALDIKGCRDIRFLLILFVCVSITNLFVHELFYSVIIVGVRTILLTLICAFSYMAFTHIVILFNCIFLLEITLNFVPLLGTTLCCIVVFIQNFMFQFFFQNTMFMLLYTRFPPIWFGMILSLFAVFGLTIRMLSVYSERQTKMIALLDSAINRLTTSNINFLNYASQIKHSTLADERKRVTRELHDVTGKSLTNIIAMLDATSKHPLSTKEEQESLLQWVRDQAQLCLKETRSVLYHLRTLNDLEQRGIPSLKNLIDTFSYATKVEVNCEWGNLPWNLPDHIETVVYKTVQESLINAFKHGKARHVDILFWIMKNQLTITIRDDGQGTKTSKKGIGQMGMSERIEELHGTVDFIPTTIGYTVLARIPLGEISEYEKA